MRYTTAITAALLAVLFILSGGLINSVGAEAGEGAAQTSLHLPLLSKPGASPGSSEAKEGIWLSPAEIRALPTGGAAWENLLGWAKRNANSPDLSNQDDQTDAVVVAKALVYVRTGENKYRDEVVGAIRKAMGTEEGAGILAVGRNLAGYVIAADLVGLDGPDDAAFRNWLDGVRFRVFSGKGPSLSVVSCHEKRPNNFGTHCGTSRLAAALYLGDTAEVQRAANVYRGWLGDRSAYAGFSFGSDKSWHCDRNKPVAINPAGCTINGHSVDGVLPDDQRRGGSFTWPPPSENYVWEALQGAVAQAYILDRHGYDPFRWSDQALLRAVKWMHEVAHFPAEGDDTATPWLINAVYGTTFPTSQKARPGKNGLGWYEWMFSASEGVPLPVPSNTPTAEPTTPAPPATAPSEPPAPTAPPPTAPPPTATATSEPPSPTATPTDSPTAMPTTEPPPPPGASQGIWFSHDEIKRLPTSGPAWQNVLNWASKSANSPDLSNQDDQTDAVVVAKALVYVRTGDASYRNEVVNAIKKAMGTEKGAGILAIGRNLAGYVIAADLVGLSGSDDAAFRQWLNGVRFELFDGKGPTLSVVSCHEKRPNNFGTHCGTSRLAAALYLGDTAEVQRAANVYRGWLGDRNAYAGFSFGSDKSWHCDPNKPVAINPAGCEKNGHPIGGVLPDDQRRGGSFTWPPPKENYVWEALQGAVAQAHILHRQGYDVYNWSDQALLRAVSWLHDVSNFPAEGDDTGTPWLINNVYGKNFPTRSANPGKNGLGFYDWYFG